MRTLGEFNDIKKSLESRLRAHPEIIRTMAANQRSGILGEQVRLELHAHWDQSLSVELIEPPHCGAYQPVFRDLARIVTEIAPQAEGLYLQSRPTRTGQYRVIATFRIPETARFPTMQGVA